LIIKIDTGWPNNPLLNPHFTRVATDELEMFDRSTAIVMDPDGSYDYFNQENQWDSIKMVSLAASDLGSDSNAMKFGDLICNHKQRMHLLDS
jgi:hypothetical protein